MSLTTEQARNLASRWVPDSFMDYDGEREQLFAWVRVLGGVDENHSVLALLAAFGWEYHAGYGSPSYTDALTLLRAARAS